MPWFDFRKKRAWLSRSTSHASIFLLTTLPKLLTARRANAFGIGDIDLNCTRLAASRGVLVAYSVGWCDAEKRLQLV